MTHKILRREIINERLTDENLVKLYIEMAHNQYFEEIYRRYVTKVYRKCLLIVKNPASAQDLTHDIFLKLILRIDTYKGNAKFSTWLYKITYHHCMYQIKLSKKVSKLFSEEISEISDDIDLNNLFDLEDGNVNNLKTAFNHLDIKQKDILLMKYVDNLSVRNIAHILKITESSVKMRLLRAREKFRDKYLKTNVHEIAAN